MDIIKPYGEGKRVTRMLRGMLALEKKGWDFFGWVRAQRAEEK